MCGGASLLRVGITVAFCCGFGYICTSGVRSPTESFSFVKCVVFVLYVRVEAETVADGQYSEEGATG